ncbi:helix-turn-helix domain-containing protein [Parabacteroides pacaensis]|uniref:helix-turn-helix domain-containing protein n=1 Tax=Parabacteroides pacaensis TaxID=2086575 RepID=UPI000D0E51B1|nr:helix-turn-helix transcriptional regulator [Parabacteroides pacaensis]
MFRLRQFRNDKGLKQSDLQELFSCTQPTISQIENGRISMPANYVRILIDKFGKEVISEYEQPEYNNASANDGSMAVAGNGNHHINANTTLEMAINEIAEQRKLVAKSQEQIDRLLSIIENFNK